MGDIATDHADIVVDKLRFCMVPRATHHLFWQCAGMLAVSQHLRTVDPNMNDAAGELMRIFMGCMILDRFGIENNQIGEITGGNQPSLLQIKIVRGQRGHFLDGLRE